jgi:phytoene synthase
MPTPTVLADVRYCERVTREHARTFTLASRFLPPAKRRAAFAVYAFCRTADDIVDDARPDGERPASAIAGYRRLLDQALDGAPNGPVFRELMAAVAAYRLSAQVLHDVISGVARDLDGAARPASWPELAHYCEGVASTVGELCACVFGVEGGAAATARAVRYARTLGVAMQLTNILRDVGEDAARGRCYLPADELAAFGLSREEVLRGGAALAGDERWRPLMAFQIGRARALYEAAAPGLSMLAADARRCAAACATGYAAILDAIEDRDYDTLTRRVQVPLRRRASLLLRVWRDVDNRRVPSPGRDGPFAHGAGPHQLPRGVTWA